MLRLPYKQDPVQLSLLRQQSLKVLLPLFWPFTLLLFVHDGVEVGEVDDVAVVDEV